MIGAFTRGSHIGPRDITQAHLEGFNPKLKRAIAGQDQVECAATVITRRPSHRQERNNKVWVRAVETLASHGKNVLKGEAVVLAPSRKFD